MRGRKGAKGKSSPALDWAKLGARLLKMTQEAVQIHQEDQRAEAAQRIPRLRLVNGKDRGWAQWVTPQGGSAA